ncbi:hypothetical protein E6H16_02040 [Candidatus Bathyarchaeota archaeon]|nr:MAG: hypothetical protein E6H16_02040 [Candidatus Bathyarchaeota archaeon]
MDLLDNLQESMFQKAKRLKEELTSKASDMGAFRKILDQRGGFIEVFLCEEACELKIKKETGATVRVVPFDQSENGECLYCHSPSAKRVYFARSY